MKRTTEWLKSLKGKLNKYWLSIIIGMIFTFLIGENNLFNRISYNRQINRLKEEIDYYNQEKANNLQQLNELHSDNESLEKLAREQYRMVKPDEELFIIKD
jgi:cell division protein FtsB